MTPEDLLIEMQTIRDELDQLEPGSPRRVELEERRAALRTAAQEAADAARRPEILKAELEHLEKRLVQFDGEKINVPAWQMAMSSGGRLTVNDPAAHAHKLNEALDEATALDRQAIEDRIRAIKKALNT